MLSITHPDSKKKYSRRMVQESLFHPVGVSPDSRLQTLGLWTRPAASDTTVYFQELVAAWHELARCKNSTGAFLVACWPLLWRNICLRIWSSVLQ